MFEFQFVLLGFIDSNQFGHVVDETKFVSKSRKRRFLILNLTNKLIFQKKKREFLLDQG